MYFGGLTDGRNKRNLCCTYLKGKKGEMVKLELCFYYVLKEILR